MKRLRRIVLVQWYLFEAEEIEIQGHAAVIGPNASGKSSLLDAVQAVLTGAHGRYWVPNASASERSIRSLRDYCLGVVRDPDRPEDLSADLRPREAAQTYLALVFEDDQDGMPHSVGLALSATLESSEHHIEGRFVLPRYAVGVADFVESTPQGRRPLPWSRVDDALRRQSRDYKSIRSEGPDAFVRKLGEVLSEDGTRHIDPSRFLRAFRNAITFKPIGNVTDFVRQYVLEDLPVDVARMREALRNYRDIRDKTEQAERRQDALKKIVQLFVDADRASARTLQYAWVVAEAGCEEVMQQILRQETLVQQLEVEEARAGEGKRRAVEGLETARRRLHQLDVRKASLEENAQKEKLEAQIAEAESRIASVDAALEAGLGTLRRFGALCPDREVLQEVSQDERKIFEGLMRLLPQGELLVAEWPDQPAAIQKAAERAFSAARAVAGRWQGSLVHEAAALIELERSLADLRERIARLEKGESDQSQSTQALIQLLAQNGIVATPLCDVADVSDERWRSTIESFLGQQREALLVTPAQAENAVRIYRNARRDGGLFGARVVNTRRAREWLTRRRIGSLAEHVVSEHEEARGYLSLLLGNVICVQTEAELLKHDRAATDDGMLASGGAVTRMAPVAAMLGRMARERQLENLKRQFQEEAEIHGRRRSELTLWQELNDRTLLPLLDRQGQQPDWTALTALRLEHRRTLQARRNELAALDLSAVHQLAAEIERAGEQFRLARKVAAEVDEAFNKIQKEVLTARLQFDALQKTADDKAALRSEAAAQPGFLAADATLRYEELCGQHFSGDVPDYVAIAREAESRRMRDVNTSQNAISSARLKFSEYGNHFGAQNEVTAETDHRTLEAWVQKTLRQLEESELALYRERAHNAEKEMEQAFRQDFINRLRDNLTRLDQQIDELNRHLKERPFHGETYRFRPSPAPGFEDVVKWIRSSTGDEAAAVGGLFDAAQDPNHAHAAAIDKVRQLLAETPAKEQKQQPILLADYRNLYVFDVRMRDEQGNDQSLAKRLGKGSGGEHQSPFYVAIGAALASTYRLRNRADGSVCGGLSLAVFDEAFSKLDVRNTASALRFLDDLGLQVLLAAPDEKYGLMAEHVDTIVNVYRSGGAVDLSVDRVQTAGRTLLGGDNPLREGAT